MMLLALGLLSAELTARLDDWMRFGTPVWDPASTVEFLQIRGKSRDGVPFKRGKPHGRYRTWTLNEHGFRSPPFEKQNRTGLPRVMVLGASESFGFAESPGKSFAERIENSARKDFQVVNASIVGMRLWEMDSYWENWLRDFHPDVVILVASPLFYLGNNSPPPIATPKDLESPSSTTAQTKENPSVSGSFLDAIGDLRIIDRLKNKLEIPQPIVAFRQRKNTERMIKEHGEDWVAKQLPEDRVELYRDHLEQLLKRIQASNCRVILTTYPVMAQGTSRPQDQSHWLSDQEKRPRFTKEAKWQYLQAIREIVLETGNSKQLPVLDLWSEMTGKSEYFYDLNHFSDSGAAIVADKIMEQLQLASNARETLRPDQ